MRGRVHFVFCSTSHVNVEPDSSRPRRNCACYHIVYASAAASDAAGLAPAVVDPPDGALSASPPAELRATILDTHGAGPGSVLLACAASCASFVFFTGPGRGMSLRRMSNSSLRFNVLCTRHATKCPCSRSASARSVPPAYQRPTLPVSPLPRKTCAPSDLMASSPLRTTRSPQPCVMHGTCARQPRGPRREGASGRAWVQTRRCRC
jgi:hypothetical protein